MRSPRSSWPAAVAFAAAALTGAPARAAAQLMGIPIAQSPFAGRPFAVALDGGSASNGIRVGGLAVAAHRPGGRLVATLGAGRVRGFEGPRTTYGGRLAFLLRFGASGALGVAPFAGYGRMQGGDSARVAQGGDLRQAGAIAVVPAGVGIGYRRLVAGRAVVAHVTPQAQWWRRAAAAGLPSASAWYGRAAVGADVAVTRQIGLSVAYEGGGGTSDKTAGPRKGVVGLALSYAPGRRAR